ncbi:MAG: ABC transporter substrate-binding protein [Anaerolineae bacterium]
MTRPKVRIALVSVLLASLLVLSACVPAAPATAPATEQPTEQAAEAAPAAEAEAPAKEAEGAQAVAPLSPPEKVTVAYVPIMKFATLYVAKERGFFDKYGLDVSIERAKSGTEIIAFLTEGKVDVGGIAIVASTWTAWSKGMDLRIIAPGALEPMENSPTMLLVRKDLYDEGKVTSVEDLKGLKVAVAGGPGSGGEYLASKALERGGLRISDVELVNLANPDMPAAFENKAIDAGLLGSPYAEQVVAAGHAVPLARDLTPGAMTVAFVASGKFINERPEVAKRFVLALVEAARAMQGDDYLSPENIAAYLAYVNTTEETLRKGVPLIYDPNQRIPIEGLKDIERVHRENGRTEYTEPIDINQVVDTSFVDFALQVLGEYQP